MKKGDRVTIKTKRFARNKFPEAPETGVVVSVGFDMFENTLIYTIARGNQEYSIDSRYYDVNVEYGLNKASCRFRKKDKYKEELYPYNIYAIQFNGSNSIDLYTFIAKIINEFCERDISDFEISAKKNSDLYFKFNTKALKIALKEYLIFRLDTMTFTKMRKESFEEVYKNV